MVMVTVTLMASVMNLGMAVVLNANYMLGAMLLNVLSHLILITPEMG